MDQTVRPRGRGQYPYQDPFELGATPETAIGGEGAPFGVRAKASFADSEEAKAKVLVERFGTGNVARYDDGTWVFKNPKDGKWYNVDEKGLAWADAADLVGDLPEMVLGGIGGAGGAAIGAPSGPATAYLDAIGGAALGGAGGAAIKKGIAPLVGVENTEGIEGNVADILRGGASAAVGEGVGFPLGAALGKIATPGAKNMTPEALERMRLAKEADINLTPADITQNRGQALVESALTNLLGSAGVMQKNRLAQLSGLTKQVDNFLGEMGGKLSAQEAGRSAASAVRASSKAFREAANERFAQVAGLAGESKLSLSGFAGKLDEITGGRLASLPTQSNALLRAFREAADGEMTLLEANAIRSELGALADSAQIVAEKKQGLFKNLLKSLDQDIETFAQGAGEQAVDALRSARAWYAMDIRRFRGATGKKLAKLIADEGGSGAPEKIVQTFFRPNNVTELMRLKEMVGAEAFDDLRQAFLTDLFKDIRLGFGAEGSAVFDAPSAAKLSSFFKKWDDESLSVLFNPEQLARFKQLDALAQSTGTAQRMAGNPSGTAQVVLTGQTIQRLGELARLGQTGAVAASGYTGGAADMGTTALGTIGIPWAMSKIILSGPWKKYTTTGFQTAAKVLRGAGKVSGGLPAAMRQSEDNELEQYLDKAIDAMRRKGALADIEGIQ